mmetsp:Transcript_46939/g.135234  ORF Transcript_46939/g.135234 Transcript_46939/m.135234 type:complete len:348 (+) Transcript_46939:1162-2205(+)
MPAKPAVAGVLVADRQGRLAEGLGFACTEASLVADDADHVSLRKRLAAVPHVAVQPGRAVVEQVDGHRGRGGRQPCDRRRRRRHGGHLPRPNAPLLPCLPGAVRHAHLRLAGTLGLLETSPRLRPRDAAGGPLVGPVLRSQLGDALLEADLRPVLGVEAQQVLDGALVVDPLLARVTRVAGVHPQRGPRRQAQALQVPDRHVPQRSRGHRCRRQLGRRRRHDSCCDGGGGSCPARTERLDAAERALHGHAVCEAPQAAEEARGIPLVTNAGLVRPLAVSTGPAGRGGHRPISKLSGILRQRQSPPADHARQLLFQLHSFSLARCPQGAQVTPPVSAAEVATRAIYDS